MRQLAAWTAPWSTMPTPSPAAPAVTPGFAAAMSSMIEPKAGAPAVACGNGKREGSELCDGADCPTTRAARATTCASSRDSKAQQRPAMPYA